MRLIPPQQLSGVHGMGSGLQVGKAGDATQLPRKLAVRGGLFARLAACQQGSGWACRRSPSFKKQGEEI